MKKCLVAALCTCIPAAAAADWQGTKWGMSVDEVLTATKRVAVVNEDRRRDAGDEIAGLKMPYTAAGLSFTAFLRFDLKARTLVAVSLEPVSNADCFKLFDTLQQKYGEPVSRVRSAIADAEKWQDAANSNSIGAIAIPSRQNAESCTVTYRPFGAKVGQGL